MLEAAAKSKLTSQQFEIFAIGIEQFVRPTMRTRDKLAHWRWGHSANLPNDLLLMNPDKATATHYTALHGKPVEIDADAVFVITPAYLDRLLDEMRRAQAFVALSCDMVGPHGTVLPSNARGLDRLSNMPSIRRELDRRKAIQEKRQAIPPLLPEEWHS
jgi:hypothetical protein